VPDRIKPDVERRIRRCAEELFSGKYTRLEIRFRGQFCYIDAYQEPQITPGWPPADCHETQDEYLERLRNTPVHLCRLRYFGPPDRWGFAFYSYGSESYQLSMFENGEFFGAPDEAFRLAAQAYLT
jgi:hypothetical protein